jgi:PAS domain S-box-containing protein
MEGRLMPLGIRQEDNQGDRFESAKNEARMTLVESSPSKLPKRRSMQWAATAGYVLGSLILATALRYLLDPFLKQDHPYASFLIAALVVAWRCGPKAGLLTGLIGLAVGVPFFAGGTVLDILGSPAGMLGVLIYTLTVVVVSAMFGSLRAARADAEQAAELAKEKQRRLEREIEAREQAQDAAREANDQTRRLLDRIAEAMLTLDLDWYVLYANENALNVLGVQREDLVGRRFWDALETGLSLELKFRLDKARKTGLPCTFELSAEGGQWTEYRAYPSVEGVTLFARNVTEERQNRIALKELNAELEQRVEERTLELAAANKELEAFCYSVSHDLRAPLRSVIAQSMMLLEDYSPRLDEEGQAKLKRLVNASKNMAQLIDDLLQLSQLNRVEMDRRQVDVSDLAQAIAAELTSRTTCGRSSFKIHQSLHADADPGLLKVAMVNLMENACKFAAKSQSPTIEVGCQQMEREVAFYVRDNGVGFDPQYADKIFRPFERLHKADEYPGTGIGLANVARVIERHGGRIWAESTPGEGATFFFTLR